MQEWVRGPSGLDKVTGQTVRSQRTVLLAAHSPVPVLCGPAGWQELRQSRGAP